MTSNWCRETLQEAIEKHGKPEILNTDQGSQFTAYEFCDWVTHPDQGIKLSMDGKGRAIDNIFIERLWRSLKYEHVYLFPASDGLECYRGVSNYFEYYNNRRRHQSLDNEHPATLINKSKSSSVRYSVTYRGYKQSGGVISLPPDPFFQHHYLTYFLKKSVLSMGGIIANETLRRVGLPKNKPLSLDK